MRLLLDTHIWLWQALEPDRLHKRVAAAITSIDSEIFLSSISVWETLLLLKRQRVDVGPDPEGWLEAALALPGLREVVLDHQVVGEMYRFELPHSDPADRMLVATARVHDLTLVTADKAILKARPCEVLSNL